MTATKEWELIKERDKYGLTQKKMADLIGKATETYKRKENGENDWTGTEMFLIANFFRTPIEKIFCNRTTQNE